MIIDFSPDDTSQILMNLAELHINPVKGNDDLDHLKEVHKRIFSDLSVDATKEARPGVFRSSVPYNDHVKYRQLESISEKSFVFYSNMDASAFDFANKALRNFNSQLPTVKNNQALFSSALADLYTKLDYFHPFSEGNSRTLRTFTQQIADDNGFFLDWEKFNESPKSRDILCIARDNGVRAIAEHKLQNKDNLRELYYSQDMFEKAPSLTTLIKANLNLSDDPAFLFKQI